MRHRFKTILYFIYLCAIKVEDYVIFLYEGSMYIRYKHYVYVEVYVNLNVEVMKSLKFLLVLTYECKDVIQEASLSPQRGQRYRLHLGGAPRM